MKILWFGDLAATGFGTVTADVGREFVKLGADIRFVSQNDFDGLPEPFLSRTLDMTTFIFANEGIEGIRDFIPDLLAGRERVCPHCAIDTAVPGPVGYLHFINGEERSCQRLRLANGEDWGDWKPDACFLLGDFYGMREMVSAAGLNVFRQLPTFHYVPVEGHDLPPAWNDLWSVIKPIAMSKFGQTEIEKITGSRPPLVYHGVDAEAFHPVSPTNPIILDGDKPLVLTSKAACKYALFGNPNVTLALRVDRFMPRKGYDALIRAMAPIMRERPQLVLGLHCRARDFGGYLPDTISKYPDLAERILNPQFGPVPRSVLLAMYNAADIYVSTSAEGFGLTIAEALACAVPAVGIDYSAVPEVIGPGGTVVPVGRLLDNEYAHHWALPDEAEFGKAVAYLVDHPHKRLALGSEGPRHVARNFRWDIAAQRFLAIAHNAVDTKSGVPDARELVAA